MSTSFNVRSTEEFKKFAKVTEVLVDIARTFGNHEAPPNAWYDEIGFLQHGRQVAMLEE